MGAMGRILVGIVAAVCLLSLAALEIVSERVRVEPVTAASPAYLADSEVWEVLGPSPVQLSRAVGIQRQTVLNVDPAARRFLSLTGTGQVLESEVSTTTVVVTENERAAGLAVLRPGDVIRVEAPHGPIQRIVVLRNGWHEDESLER
jgi:hypothetical protein